MCARAPLNTRLVLSCLALFCVLALSPLLLLTRGAVRQEGRRAQLVYCYSEAWLQVGPSDAAVRTHDKSSYVLLLADLPCVCCEPVLANRRLRITFFPNYNSIIFAFCFCVCVLCSVFCSVSVQERLRVPLAQKIAQEVAGERDKPKKGC